MKAQPEHDIFLSAFTTEGTFTYDQSVQFFNLRHEVRTAEGAEAAGTIAQAESERFLKTLGYAFHPLKVSVTDTSAMWGE